MYSLLGVPVHCTQEDCEHLLTVLSLPNSYMYNLFGPALNGFLKRELNKKVNLQQLYHVFTAALILPDFRHVTSSSSGLMRRQRNISIPYQVSV